MSGGTRRVGERNHVPVFSGGEVGCGAATGRTVRRSPIGCARRLQIRRDVDPGFSDSTASDAGVGQFSRIHPATSTPRYVTLRLP